MFFASYGSFMHKLIERYYTGKLERKDLPLEFYINFQNEVKGVRPSANIASNYISKAIKYLNNFEVFPFGTIGVEKRYEFMLGERNFQGIIDYVGTANNGDIVIIDNKSRDLQPRSGKKKPTKNDELLDSMLRQLYIYSVPVEAEFGRYPESLCFNCFKAGFFIKEPFNPEAMRESVEWALRTIEEIENEEYFDADPDMFKCRWLCGVQDECEFYQDMKEEL